MIKANGEIFLGFQECAPCYYTCHSYYKDLISAQLLGLIKTDYDNKC